MVKKPRQRSMLRPAYENDWTGNKPTCRKLTVVVGFPVAEAGSGVVQDSKTPPFSPKLPAIISSK